jgi:hypothetical protein
MLDSVIGFLGQLLETQRDVVRSVAEAENEVKRGHNTMSDMQQSIDLFDHKTSADELQAIEGETRPNDEWRSKYLQQESNRQTERELRLIQALKQSAAISMVLTQAILGVLPLEQIARDKDLRGSDQVRFYLCK